MFKRLRGYFSSDLSIDLGTANTLIYVRGKGIVLNEPSVVAVQDEASRGGGKIIVAVGAEAKMMLGRTPGHITAVRPMKGWRHRRLHLHREDAAVLHQQGAWQPLPSSPARACWCACPSAPPRSSVAPSVNPPKAPARATSPSSASPWRPPSVPACPRTRRAARWCWTSAAATSEVAVLSLNGIVYANSARIGGDRFDEAIMNYVRRNLRHPDRRGHGRAHQDRNRLGVPRPDGQGTLGEGPQPLRRRAAQLHAEQQ